MSIWTVGRWWGRGQRLEQVLWVPGYVDAEWVWKGRTFVKLLEALGWVSINVWSRSVRMLPQQLDGIEQIQLWACRIFLGVGRLHPKTSLQENLVNKTLITHPSPLPVTLEPQQLDDPPMILCTPYIRGLSEKIAKVCAPLGVKPVFRPKRTLKRELMQVKNRPPERKQTGVVYEIPCKDCPEVYVGETKRTLKVRLSEHRQAVKWGDPKNGIAVHVQKTNHCINWEGATVQRRAEGFWLRRTVEAIQIKKPPRTWTWTAASSYLWSGPPSSNHTPYPTLSPILLWFV